MFMGQQILIQEIIFLKTTEQNSHQKVTSSNAIPFNHCGEVTYNSAVYLAPLEDRTDYYDATNIVQCTCMKYFKDLLKRTFSP